MSGELPPPEEPLDSYVVAGKSLRHWHRWLNTHPETGRDISHRMTPGSRYGRYTTETSWWALAGAVAYMDQVQPVYDNPEFAMAVALGSFMHLAVTDSPDVAEMVHDGWESLPGCLKEQIGDEEDIRRLL